MVRSRVVHHQHPHQHTAPYAPDCLNYGLWVDFLPCVAEIGHLATLEGCKSAHIVKLASCVNFGQQKGNAHRDLMSNFWKGIQLCEPTPIQLDVLRQEIFRRRCLPVPSTPGFQLPLPLLVKRVAQPALTCPIYAHGDGVEFQSRDSLMTWSWPQCWASISTASAYSFGCLSKILHCWHNMGSTQWLD